MFLAIPLSLPLLAVCSLGAFLVYQVDRSWFVSPEDMTNQPDRVQWFNEHRRYTSISCMMALLIAGYSAMYLETRTIAMCALLAGFGFVYLFPYNEGQFRLKGNGYIKLLFISTCWSVGGVLLPAIEASISIDMEVYSLLAYRGFLIAANVLLADLPDRTGDLKEELGTLAVALGSSAVTRFAAVASLLSLILGVVHGIVFKWPYIIYLDLGGSLCMILLAYKAFYTKHAHTHFMYSYLADLIIAWPAVGVIVYYLFM